MGLIVLRIFLRQHLFLSCQIFELLIFYFYFEIIRSEEDLVRNKHFHENVPDVPDILIKKVIISRHDFLQASKVIFGFVGSRIRESIWRMRSRSSILSHFSTTRGSDLLTIYPIFSRLNSSNKSRD